MANQAVSADNKALIQHLFKQCGQADEVFSEADLDYLTALVGTGPGYPALLARALFKNALEQGIDERIARRAVLGVVVRASQLINEERTFEELLEALIAYRGVTAAGLEGMLTHGFEDAVTAGLKRATAVAASKLFTPR